LGCVKPISFCRDDEEPQSNTAATPSVQTAVPDKPSMQETELSAEAPRVTRSSIKKITVSQSTKRQKKSKEANVSLEAHEPSSSSDDVSDRTLEFFPFVLRMLICSLSCQALMKKFVALGTECTQYWKVVKASEG
jgi:hypothetical protein